MTVSYTAHLRLPIPDFLQEPWHAELEASIRAIDTALYQAILIQGVANWANSTTYAVGALVIDGLTGLLWTCGVAHTSPASPTTFATDRTNNPTRWNGIANIPQQRGTWVTATSYTVGDFVIDSNRYAVCIVSHTSGVFNTDLAAAKWSVLIDLSSLGVGINSQAEGTIASAATTNIGGQAPSRLFITGTTTITSFGTVANQIKILRYEGVLTLTHNATDLILLGGVNRDTAAGDIQIISSSSTGKWREINYSRGDGSPVSLPVASTTVQGKVELATTAETQALADGTRAVTPLGLAGALSDLSTSVLATIRNGVGATLDTLAEIATALGLLAPAANPTFTGKAVFTDTTCPIGLSGGTTAQRSGTPQEGDMRYNTTLHMVEYRSNSAWVPLGAATDTQAGLLQTASQSDQETGTSNVDAVTPGVQQFHPSAAKAWCKFAGATGAISASYNVASVTHLATGAYQINFTTAFSSANYAIVATCHRASNANFVACISTIATTNFTMETTFDTDGSLVDPTSVHVVCFGDQ